MDIVKGNYGDEYQRFKGDIWITKQDPSLEVQGTNVAVKSESHAHGELVVLGYVIRKGDKWTHTHDEYYTLDEIVWSVLKSKGWYDNYCNRLLNS